MNKTQVERTRRLRANNKAKGLVQVTVTIPAAKAAELKAIARGMRDASIPHS